MTELVEHIVNGSSRREFQLTWEFPWEDRIIQQRGLKLKKRLLSSPEYQLPIRPHRAFEIYVGYLIRFKTGQTINIPGSIELFFFSKPKIYLCQVTQNQ